MDLTVSLKRNKNQNVMCCIEITTRGFSFVVSLVSAQGQNQVIVLERFDSMVANEISKKIKVIVEKYSLYGAPCVVVLHPTDYNLFLIDKPGVAKHELQQAAKWAVKDMVQYPLEQLILAVFPSPNKHKIFAVATEQALVMRVVEGLGAVGLRLFKVTVTELALMNVLYVADKMPDTYCFLYLAPNATLLLYVEHGMLSFVKRLPVLSQHQVQAKGSVDSGRVFVGELKKVFADLFHVQHKEVQHLVVSPGKIETAVLYDQIHKELGCTVTSLDLSHILTSSLSEQGGMLAEYMSTLGGSLYCEA
jgi:MSHA biogenesis protein MshI